MKGKNSKLICFVFQISEAEFNKKLFLSASKK